MMKNEELVSVIVPVYKVEKYLERCVKSIAGQTYKNLEIVLVDDGSPDACPKMCDNFAKQDTRIKVIHKQNGGLSDARNVGIENSTGKYLLFVDSDDYIELSAVEILYNNLKTYDADISFSDFAYVYDDNEGEKVTGNKTTIYDKNSSLMQFVETHGVVFVTAWLKLIKREVLGNIRFPVGRLHEDEFTTYKIFTNSTKSVYTSDTLYRYYQRSGSIMQSKNIKNEIDILDAHLGKLEFVKNNVPEIYENFATRFFYFLIYPYMRIFSSKLVSKDKQKEYKKQVNELYKSLKQRKLKLQNELKVKLVLKTPRLMYFIYKLKNKE
jgi:glycosyltransferase involved in cell wall biosynthesis